MGISRCNGMFDILPSEMDSWCHLENEAIRLVQAYGYREIRTPIFENKDLYVNTLGRDSGMVQNKLWTVKSPGGENLTLRPDFTASVMRAYSEHGLYQSGFPTKLFYTGPVFWKGNGRTASNWMDYQFGMEAIGSADPSLDVEVIMMVHDLCQILGLPRVRIHLNTLGCYHCRSRYHQVLTDFFARHTGELCETCRGRYKSRPQWVMGCNEESCRNITAWVPSIHAYLCDECASHFKTVCDYLSELKVDYVVDPQVARDVDSYNRTIFHISCYGSVVAYGGRYDGLFERLANSGAEAAEIPAVGCSIDMIPLLKLFDEVQVPVGKYSPTPKVCFVGEGPEAVQLLLPVLYALRRHGICAELFNREIPSDDRLPDLSPAQFIVGLSDANVRSRGVVLFDGELGLIESRSLDDALTIIGRALGVKDLSAQLRPLDTRHWSIVARSHHTLDNNGRGRHQSEPKNRTRGRCVSLKGEGSLVGSVRESRSRKSGAGFALPASREKSASARLHNRRRPENEDSLETSPVRPADGLVPPVYAEPMLPGTRRDRKERDLSKSPKSGRHTWGEGSRERSNKRSDRVSYLELEGYMNASDGLAKGPNLRKRDLKALAFKVAADSDRLIYRPEDDEFLDLIDPVELRGKRHSRSGKLGHKASADDVGYDADLSYHDCSEETIVAQISGGTDPVEGGILDSVSRWASERYGVEGSGSSVQDLAKRNLLRGNSRTSRGGRKSLARLRGTQAETTEPQEPLSALGSAGEVLAESHSEAPVDSGESVAVSAVAEGAVAVTVADKAEKPVRKPTARKPRAIATRRSKKAVAEDVVNPDVPVVNGMSESAPAPQSPPETASEVAPSDAVEVIPEVAAPKKRATTRRTTAAKRSPGRRTAKKAGEAEEAPAEQPVAVTDQGTAE